MSIMFSSHQLGEVEKLADRIICINNGKIIETPKALDSKNRYMMQFESNIKPFEILNNYITGSTIQKAGDDSLSVEFKEFGDFGKALNKLIGEGCHVLDVYKDLIDVEAVYKEVYGERHD